MNSLIISIIAIILIANIVLLIQRVIFIDPCTMDVAVRFLAIISVSSSPYSTLFKIISIPSLLALETKRSESNKLAILKVFNEEHILNC